MKPTPLPRVQVPDESLWWALELSHRIGPEAAAKRLGLSRTALAEVIAGFHVWPTVAAKITRAHDSALKRAMRAIKLAA